MKKGEEKSPCSYSLFDKIKILRSNLFWKFVDIFSCKLKKIAEIYERVVVTEYNREIEKFGISKSKRVLHIGCGSYPITAFVLANNNIEKIVGIDKSKFSIKSAKNIISNRGLSNQVMLKYGDGVNFPLKDFDTIIISSCSIPKWKILENIFNNAPSNCKIIAREQPGPSKVVSECIKVYSDKINFINKIDNRAFPTSKWESYCIIKK